MRGVKRVIIPKGSFGEAQTARVSTLARVDVVATVLAVLAATAGVVAAILYFRAGLSLSHYDAKAHLVVSRRILDSLTPGWEQIGAVWLPLPHVLNMVPVQVDALYRTGASAIAISLAAFTLAAYSTAVVVIELTGSRSGATLAVLLFAVNPNLLYLQSTPMTEPLLLGLSSYGLACLTRWAARAGRGGQILDFGTKIQDLTPFLDQPQRAGLAFAGACLTRYEAWPITAAALTLAAAARWRHGDRLEKALSETARIALYPAAAIVFFLFLSRATVGEWFVTGGFFVPDNPSQGRLGRVLVDLWWGTRHLSGVALVLTATAGVLATTVAVVLRRRPAHFIVPLAAIAAGALPAYAFFSGHPFRIRYMIPLVAAGALWSGVAVGLLPRLRYVAAAVVGAVALWQSPPWDQDAAMVREAQWDLPYAAQRRVVTRCIEREHPSDKILMSMGSLGHYMQDTSHAGFALRDFIHEGTGSFWIESLIVPARHAAWIVIEERAEGGDALFQLARQKPEFLNGFERTCEAGGLALYKRISEPGPAD